MQIARKGSKNRSKKNVLLEFHTGKSYGRNKREINKASRHLDSRILRAKKCRYLLKVSCTMQTLGLLLGCKKKFSISLLLSGPYTIQPVVQLGRVRLVGLVGENQRSFDFVGDGLMLHNIFDSVWACCITYNQHQLQVYYCCVWSCAILQIEKRNI